MWQLISEVSLVGSISDLLLTFASPSQPDWALAAEASSFHYNNPATTATTANHAQPRTIPHLPPAPLDRSGTGPSALANGK